jgi:hypothetical protein
MRLRLALSGLVLSCMAALGAPSTETVEQALCRLIDQAAGAREIPAEFLTRLIWQESSFRTGVTSPAGAQGIAQFMPGTAKERGLEDPFDPEQAIPKAAELIHDLVSRFGNLGLAAAAYNGGPARVALWLSGQGGLPAETRNYVYAITGRPVEDWAAHLKDEAVQQPAAHDGSPSQHCLQIVATLRRPGRRDAPEEAPFAPWGVQLAGNFSKSVALSSYSRARQAYVSLLGDVRPMIIGTRLRSRGTRTFYRVRAPAASRGEATQLCEKIRKAGGSCIVLPS